MRRPLALLILFAAHAAAVAGSFAPLAPPAAPDQTLAAADLPAALHMRNKGGSDGAGLCVFTSIEHCAAWQNVPELAGFQLWMTRKPGGGYPSKVDQMLAAFCREKGVPVPAYVQHEGGDERVLELAIKTGRMVAVTYGGSDDFYRSYIAHMVNLVHLDAQRAAILDNNRPGVFVWMTRADFLKRWKAGGGGWAVVLLASPPPPYAGQPTPHPVGPAPKPSPDPDPRRPGPKRPNPGPTPNPQPYDPWNPSPAPAPAPNNPAPHDPWNPSPGPAPSPWDPSPEPGPQPDPWNPGPRPQPNPLRPGPGPDP